MVYDAFRVGDFPTLYPDNKTPVTADVLEVGFIYATVILAFSLLIGLPGLHGKEIGFSALKIVIGVFVTSAIMLSNYGQEWEVAHIEVETQYRAGLLEEIHADIGVKIGLRSVNITLKTEEEETSFNDGKVIEKINYNERFSWNDLGFAQGRGGFGPNAGLFNRQFRDAQWKGVPYPILWIAEYFTIDGEGIRWGRHYRQAGYYTHIMVWLAFPCWILSMVMMHAVIRYGAYLAAFTGFCLWLGNILYATIRNPFQLAIRFGEETLVFSWGWTFYLNLFTGILCTVLGIVLFALDLFFHEKLSSFFGVDILQDYEEIYVAQEEVLPASRGKGSAVAEADSDYEDTNVTAPPRILKYRKRSAAFTKRIQKTINSKRAYMTQDIEMATSGGRLGSASENTQEDVFFDSSESRGASADGNRSEGGKGKGYTKMVKQ